MKQFKNCIIRTHNDRDLTSQVNDIGINAGYRSAPIIVASSICYGDWPGFGGIKNNCLNGDWDWNIAHCPSWPRFCARTEMDKILAFFSDEPEFDESPLPNTMDENLERSTKAKFNLSDEQWGCLPPMARDALAGAKVARKTTTHKWIPITEDSLPPGGTTVVFTNNPEEAGNDVDGYVKVGYDDQVMNAPTGWVPTHYCELPYVARRDEEEEEEE